MLTDYMLDDEWDTASIRMTFEMSPVPKGRPRFGRFGAYTPKETSDFKTKLLEYFALQYGFYRVAWEEVKDEKDLAIAVDICFLYAPPKRKSKRTFRPKVTKPDLDNLEKAILDAFNGTLWKDEKIFSSSCSKLYADIQHDKFIVSARYHWPKVKKEKR